jgi:hypothetical protein
MKRNGWLILILISIMALSLPALTQCTQPGQAAASEFDGLAHRVPSDAEQAFFMNFKPDGEAGRHWERIRQHLAANPTGQQALDGLFHTFGVELSGLDEFIVGPAVSGYSDGAAVEYAILQVSDEEAAENSLRQRFPRAAWEQKEFEGWTLHHGRNMDSWRQRDWEAWAIGDGLLFRCSWYGYDSPGDDEPALTYLRELVGLDRADSLAALPAWRTLRDRLPQDPMALVFFNVAAVARRNPPAPNDDSLGTALSQQLEALAAAAVPEEAGMRVEIAGTIALEADARPEFRALLDLPAVDPAAWTGLPADTAITLVAHDASVLWPWLEDMLNLNSLNQVSSAAGLDLEADLAGAEGPLTGEFALAITPPLPDQPISQGLPAGQLLILARDVSQAQMDRARREMEGRGAVFGPEEIQGVALQTQVGTELSGYAISYGFDLGFDPGNSDGNGTLLFGSSPDVIGQAVTAQREGKGLVRTPNFQSMLAALPKDPSLLVYLNSGPLTGTAQLNMTAEDYQSNEEYLLLEVFEAVGWGLRLAPDWVDGVAYFFVR